MNAETYSAVPPEGTGVSSLPLVMLAAGLLGAFGSYAMQAYAATDGYSIDVGGRPDLFWPAYVPFAFETGVLFAIAAGFFGYFIVVGLPHLYDPVDESDRFRAAMRDGWFVVIRGDTSAAAGLLATLHPISVEELAG